MPWEYEWALDFFRDTVTLQTFSTVGAYGNQAYASSSGATVYRAYLERGEHKVKAADGTEAVATLAIFLGQTTSGGSVPSPSVKDRFILSDSSSSTNLPRPLSIERWIDPESTQNYLAVVHCA